jgi:hypothetical protein
MMQKYKLKNLGIGCEERKAQPHTSLNSEKILRPGTRISRITRIYTDTIIRAHPCDPCSIVNNLEEKIRHQWVFLSCNRALGGAMSIELKPISATSAPASSCKNYFWDGRAVETIASLSAPIYHHPMGLYIKG